MFGRLLVSLKPFYDGLAEKKSPYRGNYQQLLKKSTRKARLMIKDEATFAVLYVVSFTKFKAFVGTCGRIILWEKEKYCKYFDFIRN